MPRVMVSECTQVNHDGTVYSEGETLDVDDATARRWETAGLVTAAPAVNKPAKRVRKST